MKTTDSVMREFDEFMGNKDYLSRGYRSYDDIKAFLSLSLAEARRELIDEIYNWGKSTKNGEDVYNPRMSMAYLERLHYEQHKSDLLTGDNPESETL